MSERDATAREAAAVRAEYERRLGDPVLQRYYARAAGAIERTRRARRERLLELLDRLGERDGLRVLDVGCGDGGDLRWLTGRGFAARHLAGVDLFPGLIARAPRDTGTLLAVADAAELPFRDGGFDAVVQTMALSSIVDPLVRSRVAAEMLRTVRRGGLVISYDMRTADGNSRVIALDEPELRRLFRGAGPLSVEHHGLHLGIASRVPAVIGSLLARISLLRRWSFAVIERAETGQGLAETYASYERRGHARRWYGETTGDALMTAEREAWIVAALGGDASGVVVDVGCGDANVARVIERAGGRPRRYVGLDLLHDRLVDARSRTPWAQLAAARADRLPLRDGVADAVVLSTLVSSIREPWQRASAAREIERITRPGGRVVVYDLRYPSPANREVRPVSVSELRRLFPGWRVAQDRTLTLAPPLARSALGGGARRYGMLSRIRPLRSHVGVVLEKPR